MRKLTQLIVVGLLLHFAIPTTAQSTSGEELHQLYWTYKNRLKTTFMKIGKEPGQSFPMSGIWNETGQSTFCNSNVGRAAFGVDGLSFHAYYMISLALEYRLLAENQKSTTATLNELYYAISAIDRIDENSEVWWLLTSNKNGFLARSDVNASTYQAWQTQHNVQLTESGGYQKFEKDVNQNCVEKSDYLDFPENANIMSQDHVSNLLLAFCFIKKHVPNILVQPRAADPAMYINTAISDITTRMMNHITETKTWTRTKGTGTYTYEQNWILLNPATGKKVSQENGGNFWILSKAFADMAQIITGSNQWQSIDLWFKKDIGSYSLSQPLDINYTLQIPLSSIGQVYENWAGSEDLEGMVNPETWESINNFTITYPNLNDIRAILHDFFDNWNFNNTPTMSKVVELQVNLDEKVLFNNLTMILPKFSVLNYFSEEEFNTLCTNGNYSLFKLLYMNYHDLTNTSVVNECINLLMDAPKMHNPHREFGGLWMHASAIEHCNRTKGDEPQDFFNGIDYLLSFNLCLYSVNDKKTFVNNPNGYTENSCDCSVSDLVTFSSGGSTISYKWLANEVKTTNKNSGVETISKFHTSYVDIGVETFAYFTKDNYLSQNTGSYSIKTSAVVCNGKTVTAKDGGSVIVGGSAANEKATLIVRKGSKLILGESSGSGLLQINAGSRVIIEEGGELVVNQNASVQLTASDAVLEIRGKIVLGANAIFSPTGAGYILFNRKHTSSALGGPYCISDPTGTGTVSFTSSSKQKMIEIASNTHFYPEPNLKLLKIENIKIESGTDAGVKLETKHYHIVNNIFTKIPSISNLHVHEGLSIYNAKQHEYITSNKFEYAKWGIYGIRSSHYPVYVWNNTFENCSFGINLITAKIHIAGNKFINCNSGVFGSELRGNISEGSINIESNSFAPHGLVSTSSLSSSNVTSHKAATLYGATYPHIAVTGNVFSLQENGIYSENIDQLVVKCNYFFRNNTSAWQDASGTINLSTIDQDNTLSTHYGFLSGGNNIIQPNGVGLMVTQFRGSIPLYTLNDGFNNFDLNYSGANFVKSVVVDRPGNSFVNNPYTINNNKWSVAIVSSNYPGSIEENFEQHFSIFEGFPIPAIYGITLQNNTTCPIAEWSDALTDGTAFDASAVSTPLLMKTGVNSGRPFTLNQGGYNVIGNVPSGTFSGSGITNSFSTALADLITLDPVSGLLKANSTGISNMADLLKNSYALRTSQHVSFVPLFEKGYHSWMATLSTLLEDSIQINSSDSAMIYTNAMSVFDEIDLVHSAMPNDEATTHLKYVSKRDRMIVQWIFGKYSDALTNANSLYTLGETYTNEINKWICRIHNDKYLQENSLTLVEYEQNLFNCTQIFMAAERVRLESVRENIENPEVPEELPEISIAPNPTTSGILSFNVNVPSSANIQYAVYSKFGLNIVPITNIGTQTAGNANYNASIINAPNDIYSLVVYINGVPYSKLFSKAN